jgi:hypothetical protein
VTRAQDDVIDEALEMLRFRTYCQLRAAEDNYQSKKAAQLRAKLASVDEVLELREVLDSMALVELAKPQPLEHTGPQYEARPSNPPAP